MNLFLRLFYVFLTSLSKPRLPLGCISTTLRLMTLPNDLDINLHVNNGRYLTLCDLSRVDMFLRTGLAALMVKRGWYPVLGEHTMIYRKSLGVFQRFDLELAITHWDDKFVHMTHRFVRDGKVYAEGTSKGAIRCRQGVIPPDDIMQALAEARGRRD